MTDREKLVELLYGHSIDTKEDAEYVADHLIAHGVTVREPQKPLTMDEFCMSNLPVYCEIKGRKWIRRMVVERVDFASGGLALIFLADIEEGCGGIVFDEGVLNKRIRLWGETPTEEERKMAKWRE